MKKDELLQRRRKSQKSGVWSNASAAVGKDLQELTSFLGSNSLNCQSDRQEPAPDPFFSPFVCSTPFPNPKDYKKDVSSIHVDSTPNADRYILFLRRIFVCSITNFCRYITFS